MIKKNSVKNGYLKSRNLSEEKNPSRAQIFRYFRIESRNNKKSNREKSYFSHYKFSQFCLKNQNATYINMFIDF